MAFIVVIEVALSGISYQVFFSIISKKLSLPAEKMLALRLLLDKKKPKKYSFVRQKSHGIRLQECCREEPNDGKILFLQGKPKYIMFVCDNIMYTHLCQKQNYHIKYFRLRLRYQKSENINHLPNPA